MSDNNTPNNMGSKKGNLVFSPSGTGKSKFHLVALKDEIDRVLNKHDVMALDDAQVRKDLLSLFVSYDSAKQ